MRYMQRTLSRVLDREYQCGVSLSEPAVDQRFVKHDEYSSFSKREKGIALYIYSAFQSPIIQSAKHGKYSSFSKHKNPAALYIRHISKPKALNFLLLEDWI